MPTTLLFVRTRLPSRSELRGLLVVGAGVVLGFPLLTSIAMRDTPAACGAIVVGLLPLATECRAHGREISAEGAHRVVMAGRPRT